MPPGAYIQREITPISKDDLFVVLDYDNAKFGYPVHYHSDYELNLIIGASGERIVGNTIQSFGESELVLIGPNLPHKWDTEVELNRTVTIQFHNNLFDAEILSRRLFAPIRDMLNRSSRGIEFSAETVTILKDKILDLTHRQGFDMALHFFAILYELAVSRDQRLLADPHYNPHEIAFETSSRRINRICEYVGDNYSEQITLHDISSMVGMSESGFSHFFKKKTQRNFIDYLNEIRIGHATQMLLETTNSISEICFACGFTSISNFIKVFKRKKGETPSDYRQGLKRILTKH